MFRIIKPRIFGHMHFLVSFNWCAQYDFLDSGISSSCNSECNLLHFAAHSKKQMPLHCNIQPRNTWDENTNHGELFWPSQLPLQVSFVITQLYQLGSHTPGEAWLCLERTLNTEQGLLNLFTPLSLQIWDSHGGMLLKEHAVNIPFHARFSFFSLLFHQCTIRSPLHTWSFDANFWFSKKIICISMLLLQTCLPVPGLCLKSLAKCFVLKEEPS